METNTFKMSCHRFYEKNVRTKIKSNKSKKERGRERERERWSGDTANRVTAK